MRYQFIYNSKESRYYDSECYYIYDTINKEEVTDVYNNRTSIHVDRKNRVIYFYGMFTDYHWILERYFNDIINEFLDLADVFNIIGYTVDEECIGGQIYYKHK